MGGGEVMVAFVWRVSFELGFHRLLGETGDVQKLGWERPSGQSSRWTSLGVPGLAREASNEFRK